MCVFIFIFYGVRLDADKRTALRIIRASDPPSPLAQAPTSSKPIMADSLNSGPTTTSIFTGTAPGVGPSHKSTTSRFRYRLDASRNLWDGSGLKVDSALTDVGWAYGGKFGIWNLCPFLLLQFTSLLIGSAFLWGGLLC